VKTKSHSFPALTKQTRFISVNAEGFKWFQVNSSGGKGNEVRSISWTHVRGAARVGEWNELLGVEVVHPGFKSGLTVLWCKNEVERDEMIAAINSFCRLK